VHPEAYPVVDRIAKAHRAAGGQLIGNGAVLAKLDPKAFVDERFGVPTVQDILRELEKPGRDPRPEFKTAQFSADVHKISDLKPGMVLEGVVTNVAAFGAFIDIGVHQDGLAHVSASCRTSTSRTRARWSRPARSSRCGCSRSTRRASASGWRGSDARVPTPPGTGR
jgi:uncharacterized protein